MTLFDSQSHPALLPATLIWLAFLAPLGISIASSDDERQALTVVRDPIALASLADRELRVGDPVSLAIVSENATVVADFGEQVVVSIERDLSLRLKAIYFRLRERDRRRLAEASPGTLRLQLAIEIDQGRSPRLDSLSSSEASYASLMTALASHRRGLRMGSPHVRVEPSYVMNRQPRESEEWDEAVASIGGRTNNQILRVFLEGADATLPVTSECSFKSFFPGIAGHPGANDRFHALRHTRFSGIEYGSTRVRLKVASAYHLPAEFELRRDQIDSPVLGDVMLRSPAAADRATLEIAIANEDGTPVTGVNFLFDPITFGGAYGHSIPVGDTGEVVVRDLAPQSMLIGFSRWLNANDRTRVSLTPGGTTVVRYTVSADGTLRHAAPIERRRGQTRPDRKFLGATLTVDHQGVRTIESPSGVALSDGFESSPRHGRLAVLAPEHFVVDYGNTQSRYRCGWFLFRVTNAKGKEVRVDLVGGRQNQWRTLNPVICDTAELPDAAIDSMSAREQNAREDRPVLRQAENGPMLPSVDDEPWRFVEVASVVPGENTLRFRFTPTSDSCYLAMRPPLPMTHLSSWIERLEKDDSVIVHDLGKSDEGWPLSIIELPPIVSHARTKPDDKPLLRKSHPCVVLNAQELGDMPDTGWAAVGAVEAYRLAASGKLPTWPKNTTVLVIPALDPDSVFQARWIGAAFEFRREADATGRWGCSLSRAYAKFFADWAAEGYRLDALLTLYNCESAEFENLRNAAIGSEVRDRSAHEALHDAIIAACSDGPGIADADVVWDDQHPTRRLSGYVHSAYGTLIVPWFINSRGPTRHLSIAETMSFGPRIIRGAASFLHSEAGVAAGQRVTQSRREQDERRLYTFQTLRPSPRVNSLKLLGGLTTLKRDAWPEDANRWERYRKAREAYGFGDPDSAERSK